jgi:hypothetical protein
VASPPQTDRVPTNTRQVHRDRGQSTVEYLGAIALAVVLILAVVGALQRDTITEFAENALCKIQNAVSAGPAVACAGSEDQQPPPPAEVPEGVDPDSQLAQQMQATAWGRETLQWLSDHDIEVVIDPKQKGAYYSDGAIVLGAGYDNAPVLIHEGNHAKYDDEGRHADPKKLDRTPFITAAIDEEADGLVQQILGAEELRRAGQAVSQQPAEDKYDAAYAAAKKNGRSDAEAQQAGADAVNHSFYDGTLVASTSGKSYTEFYGEQWDDAH